MFRHFLIALLLVSPVVSAQNPLVIPDTLTGPVFNLNVQTGSVQFFPPNNTPTYAVNGNFLGPTLIWNKWDTVTMNVTNNLPVPTTMHWHGMHVPAVDDGGPHQVINPGSTWSPQFRVLNDAATYWYHPHGLMQTEMQVTKGIAGLIIVRDSNEASFNLPRHYGVDDFPLVVQSKSFDVLYQLAPYTVDDSIMMVNGTIDPYLQVPQQVVRLRLLNGSADRAYDFGLEGDSTFYIISSDGGLLAQPVPVTRLILSPGERAEILINFTGYSIGQSIYLKNYGSDLPRGYMGADSVGDAQHAIPDYYNNPLNGADFNVLRLDVVGPSPNAITTIPGTFTPLNPWLESQATVQRTIEFTADTSTVGPIALVEGPFLMNGQSFDMDSINQVCYLNEIEIWTLVNNTMVAHPFHIHDIQFYVLDINGVPPSPELAGKKDLITVDPFDTVRFITRFTDFTDTAVPYMYHCHLLHHEDEGMMGCFIVIDTTALHVPGLVPGSFTMYPNPADEVITIEQVTRGNLLTVYDASGQLIYSSTVDSENMRITTSGWCDGIYFLRITDGKQITTQQFMVTHQ